MKGHRLWTNQSSKGGGGQLRDKGHWTLGVSCPPHAISIHLARFLSSQVWKLGWSPKPGGDFGTVFPEIPVEFLQEKEILKEFIYRINTLGIPPQSSSVPMCHLRDLKPQGRAIALGN